jgi:hypothetical protein
MGSFAVDVHRVGGPLPQGNGTWLVEQTTGLLSAMVMPTLSIVTAARMPRSA